MATEQAKTDDKPEGTNETSAEDSNETSAEDSNETSAETANEDAQADRETGKGSQATDWARAGDLKALAARIRTLEGEKVKAPRKLQSRVHIDTANPPKPSQKEIEKPVPSRNAQRKRFLRWG